MTWDEELESLFDLPMFEDVRLPAPKITADDRLEQSFMEIVVRCVVVTCHLFFPCWKVGFLS